MVPLRVMGWVSSDCALNEWCAATGRAAISKPAVASKTSRLVRISDTSEQPFHRPFAVSIAPAYSTNLRLGATIVGRPDKHLPPIGEDHFTSRRYVCSVPGPVSHHGYAIADLQRHPAPALPRQRIWTGRLAGPVGRFTIR